MAGRKLFHGPTALLLFAAHMLAFSSSTPLAAYFHPGILEFTVGVTSTEITTLTNASAQRLLIKSFDLVGAKASNFSMRTTCGTSLAAGASCDVTLTGFATKAGLLGKIVEYDNSVAGQHQVVLEANEASRKLKAG